jgi:N-acetylglucosamine kinase-like BadF-type ATPase
VAEHFGQISAEQVGLAMHLGTLDAGRLSELSPLLFAVAATGDAVARSVVDRQADEVVSLARIAAGRVGLLDSPFALVLGGGVLRARHPLLLEPIAAGIAAVAPKAAITVVDAPPVLGAALWALDALGADAATQEAVRAALSAR